MSSSSSSAAPAAQSEQPVYPRLCFLVRQHLEDDFWKGELSSNLTLAGYNHGLLGADTTWYPFIIMPAELTKDQAIFAGSRSIMVKKVLEIWGGGDNLQDLKAGFERCGKRPYCAPSTVGRKKHGFPAEEFAELCKDLPEKGEDDYVTINIHAPLQTTSWYAFACRVLASGCFDLLKKFTLKERKYLGPTTLTPELAFLMANLALVDASKLVMDPYIGTGGALIGAAYYNATMIGMEIDWRIVNEGQPFRAFDQYGLKRPDVYRGDFSREGRCLREMDVAKHLFDAIIGDPPYGIRAGARKTGTFQPGRAEITPEFRKTHIPQMRKYDGEDVIRDLLDAASTLLRPAGRLVFLYPLETSLWKEMENAALPTHPDLVLLYTAHQIMRCGMSRILVTMERKPLISNDQESKRLKNIDRY